MVYLVFKRLIIYGSSKLQLKQTTTTTNKQTNKQKTKSNLLYQMGVSVCVLHMLHQKLGLDTDQNMWCQSFSTLSYNDNTQQQHTTLKSL